MSYILDALKKSEKERLRGAMPDPLAIQEIVSHIPRKRALWPYIIIFGLVLNAAVFAFWSGLLPSKKSVSIVKSFSGTTGSNKEETPPLSLTNKDESGHAMKQINRREVDLPSGAIISNNKGNIQQTQPLPAEAETKKKAQDYRRTPVEAGRKHALPPAESLEATAVHSPTEAKHPDILLPEPNRVYNLSELPLSIRQNLPDFLVSVFFFSDDPASRLVRINGQMMKEGEYLKPGLKLEEIVPRGVIFSYQNYRFLIGPK